MRLFLASADLNTGPTDGAFAIELETLVGPGGRTAIVLNGRDDSADRDQLLEQERRGLGPLGLDGFELDLRAFLTAGGPAMLREALRGVGLVWVTGGNLIVLRDAMTRSGLDGVLAERVGDGSLTYAGYSAGAIAAGPTLRESDLSDHPSDADAPQWGGAGLIDFTIVPHYQSGGPESADMDRIAAHLRSRRLAYVALRDGHALVLDASSTRVIG